MLARATPLYLVGGEQSAAGWDVPDRVPPKAGHMMMLEDPATFCRIVEAILYDGDCRSGA